MADIMTGTSGYQTGSIDTATAQTNNVSPHNANHINGVAQGVIQVETILGDGPTLKGNVADLVTRLNVLLNADGQLKITGFTGLITNYGLLASSATAMAIMNHTPIGVLQAYAGAA